MTWGGDLNVQVKGTTPTQAILSYTAPDNSPCTVAVSESSSLAALVNDVNPALFEGANSDARAGNVIVGTSRIVVIGKRTSERAADGNFYSRALHAFTQHYFQVTCGAAAGSGTFTTENPPLGNSAPDSVPFAAGAWGNLGWPTMSWSGYKRYIDPLTGLLIERVTGPGQSGGSEATLAAASVADPAGAWTSPASLLGSNAFASTSATGASNAIYFPVNFGSYPAAGFQAEGQTDDVQVSLTGYTDTSGDTISACLSVNHGQSCVGTPLSLSLPKGTGHAAPVSGPSSFPAPLFSGWGAPAITAEQGSSLSGTVTVNGSAVSWGSSDGSSTTYFPLSIVAGDHILISGSAPICPNNDCTISSLKDAEHLTIMQNLGSWTGFSTSLNAAVPAGATGFTLNSATGLIFSIWQGKYMRITFADGNPESVNCATLSGSAVAGCGATSFAHATGATVTQQEFALPNFGVMIWNSSQSGTVFLQNAQYTLAESNLFSIGDDGSYDPCSVSTVAVNYAANGTTPLTTPLTGRICQLIDIYSNPTLYLFVPSTGETRLLAYGQPSIGNGTIGTFDPSDPDTQYYAQNNSPNPNIFKCSYNAAAGNYAALAPNYTGASSPNYSCTSVTSGTGNDLFSQIGNVVPGFNSTYFNRVSGFGGMSGNYISVTVQLGQNSIGYSCFFDVTQPAGKQIVACHDTWSTYPERWGGAHGTFQPYTAPGWGAIFLVPLTDAGTTGIGQYQLSVNAMTGESGTTALTPNLATDPTTQSCSALGVTDPRWIALGATGNNCIQMTVATEPQNQAPSAADAAQWPSSCHSGWAQLQSVQPGDYVIDSATGFYGEQFLVAAKTGSGCSPITLVLARGVNQACASAPQAHSNGWIPMMTATQNCDGNEYWYQVSNPSTAYADNSSIYAAHSFTGQADGTGINLVNYVVYAAQFHYNSYGVRQGTLPDLIGQTFSYGLNMTYPFADSTAGIGINYIQTHPGGQSYLMAPNTLGYDGRPIGGAGGGVGTAWYHTLTGPVSGTSQVYKISPALNAPNGAAIESLDRKRLGMVAFAGRYLLTDVSGPRSTITDASVYAYCIADFTGECRPGSSAGDRFVNVPNIDTTGTCAVGALDRNTPCLATANAEVGNAVQFNWGMPDPNAMNWRRLGYALGGPGQTNNYWNVHGIVDGSWAFTEVDWKDGIRKDIVAIQLPPWPRSPGDRVPRSDFVRVVIPVAGQTGDQVRIRFGYDENLYCTSRREPCTTAGGAPFSWLSEVSGGGGKPGASQQASFGVPCSSSCDVDIPAYSARILYYVVDHLSAAGSITSSTMQVVAVP
jgi:hypothetical protein